jgi:hypothetical protein
MKEDCLFGLEHLFCALARNGDENEMFGFHNNTIFRYLTTLFNIFCSPVRLIPAIGVMSGAHYRRLLIFFMLATTQRATVDDL